LVCLVRELTIHRRDLNFEILLPEVRTNGIDPNQGAKRKGWPKGAEVIRPMGGIWRRPC
jgi:hypothetical protein